MINPENQNRKGITTLLFDMDNTLFDLVGAQINSCHAVTKFLGTDDGKNLFDYFLRPIHGFESHNHILDYMVDQCLTPDGIYLDACRIFESEKLRHITPYAGVKETLERLKGCGYPMGIVTDAFSRDAIIRLEKVGLLPYFCGMVTYDMVGVKKPSPEPFLFAMEMLKAKPDEVLLIGDSPRRDIEPCKKLGICSVYARYGDRFFKNRNICNADFTIDAMDELPGILTRLS
ncbi:MAG: HAD family hydrolase [Methanomicrobiales archaeon HGW-Methanomicrobiales-5]|nr:MAG: HAD family hydrolase [Methanomicrobiales archaeon HGW-Methanomicrobiales-5]